MKKYIISTLAVLIAALFLAQTAPAQNVKKFAVLPFSYNGPQKLSYFPRAFQSKLNNDLEWAGQVVPAPDSTVEGVPAPKSAAQALDTLRSTGLDYIVTGDIAILDKEATIKLEAFAKDGATWSKKGQMPVDEISPWLDDQSKVIMGDVFHRPGYSTAETATQDAKAAPTKNPTTPGNSAFLAADGAGDYQPDKLNPQFRYEGGTDTSGRWRSQTLRFFSNSMCVGDGDGDGKNEVFLLTKTGIAAYRFNDGKLKLLQNLELSSTTEYLRLEMVDVDRDGIEELVIGSYQMYYRSLTKAPEGWVKSHILSFKDGQFKFLIKDYKRFLGVLRMPPTYSPILVAQSKGVRHLYAKRINEAFYKDGKIVLGQSIPSPEFGNIYSMVYLPDDMGYKYLVLDDFHRLKVYSQTMERLYSSDQDTYNSSGIAVTVSERPVGMGPGLSDEAPASYNVPFRMVVASLSKKGKYELLVNKDLSMFAQIFERFNYYSQGEVHALVWDGVGMNMAWKTRRIKGQVSDLALADLNNDGKKQLVVLVNTFPGGLGFNRRKTVILAYDLEMP